MVQKVGYFDDSSQALDMRWTTRAVLDSFAFMRDLGFKHKVWRPVGIGTVVTYSKAGLDVVVDVNERHSIVFVSFRLDDSLKPEKGIGLWHLLEDRAPSENRAERQIRWERESVCELVADNAHLVREYASDILQGEYREITRIAAQRQLSDQSIPRRPS